MPSDWETSSSGEYESSSFESDFDESTGESPEDSDDLAVVYLPFKS